MGKVSGEAFGMGYCFRLCSVVLACSVMLGCAASKPDNIAEPVSVAEEVDKSSLAPLNDPVAGEQLVKTAHKAIGTPYVYGGTTLKGFDCSGFVRWAYDSIGIHLPRTAREQSVVGEKIERIEDMQPGDIVAFNHPKRGYHTGIYIGEGNFIHSPRKRTTVRINSLSDSYFSQTLLGARRVDMSGAQDLVAQAQSRLDQYSAQRRQQSVATTAQASKKTSGKTASSSKSTKKTAAKSTSSAKKPTAKKTSTKKTASKKSSTPTKKAASKKTSKTAKKANSTKKAPVSSTLAKGNSGSKTAAAKTPAKKATAAKGPVKATPKATASKRQTSTRSVSMLNKKK